MLLDRYYTPERTADFLVESAGTENVRTCFDSNCGDGSLLEATARRHGDARCMGMDKNQNAVRRLRRKHPTWVLSAGDALTPGTWSRVKAASQSKACDLVTMNPPFSMTTNKGVAYDTDDIDIRCSVAMAHLLTTLKNTSPERCCAIVPESLVNSQLDDDARAILERDYKVAVVAELKNSTFRGARANAVVLNLKKRSRKMRVESRQAAGSTLEYLVRGGLPVHEAERYRAGFPFIHTTSLLALENGVANRLPRVRPIARGLVSGHVILLPRVGVPLRPPRPVFFGQRVQLSDCVIAVTFESKRSARRVAKEIGNQWEHFVRQWRGTGARYTTMRKLGAWFTNADIL